MIWDQITGKIKKAHDNDLKLDEIEEWKILVAEMTRLEQFGE